MRALVFLLILANLLFFVWAQGYFGPPENPDALRVQQQLNAEKIRIVARDEPPAGDAAEPAAADRSDPAAASTPPVNSPPAAETAAICVRLAELPAAAAERIEALLGEQWPAYTAQRATPPGEPGYWVYIPPLASKQEVDNKAAELKRLRVPELFIVQENGANNRAISLGLFSTREAANARLEALRALGVRSARVGERGNRPATVQIDIRGPQAQSDALRQALAAAVPEARVADCSTPP